MVTTIAGPLVFHKRFRCPGVVLFKRLAVIDEGLHRQAPGDLWRGADMIAVKMCDEQIVEPAHLRRPCRGDDALRITIVLPGEAGIDQQRLPGRRHDESGLPAFDIDEVDVQGRPRLDGGLPTGTCWPRLPGRRDWCGLGAGRWRARRGEHQYRNRRQQRLHGRHHTESWSP